MSGHYLLTALNGNRDVIACEGRYRSENEAMSTLGKRVPGWCSVMRANNIILVYPPGFGQRGAYSDPKGLLAVGRIEVV